MGKYQNSNIHAKFSHFLEEYTKLQNRYSDFHVKTPGETKIRTDCHMTDIDRLWVEIRDGKIVAVVDIKYYGDDMTYAEKIIAKFFIDHGIPYLIISMPREECDKVDKVCSLAGVSCPSLSCLSEFKVLHYNSDGGTFQRKFTRKEFIDFINNIEDYDLMTLSLRE